MVELFLELMIGVGVPSAFGVAAAIRYFLKKEKCFTLLKAKVEELAEHDGDSNETHKDYDYRLDIIERNQSKNEIYLKLLLDKFDIPYNK